MLSLPIRVQPLPYRSKVKLSGFSTICKTHPTPNLLRHNHIQGEDSSGIVSYDHAALIQERLRAEILAWKAKWWRARPDNESPPERPLPNLISFESTPTFTLGRRQEGLSPKHISRLEQPLRIHLTDRKNSTTWEDATFMPQIRKTDRGGLMTYHGPGQLVLWPVLDMHSPLYPRYSVASYAAHLEATTQRLLTTFGIRTYTSRHEPGVWVSTAKGPERKIAALGVHHKRYVTALGIALNVDMPLEGTEDVNPWARFVPCGLEGKLVTSVAAETEAHDKVWNLKALAETWAEMFSEGLYDSAKRTSEL